MTTFYRRRRPSGWETLASAVAAAGAGALVFYFARILLGRDAIPADPPRAAIPPGSGAEAASAPALPGEGGAVPGGRAPGVESG